jgi:hypothetical protein
MSTVSKDQRFCSRQAVPISDTPRGPGKASGNMVRTETAKVMGKRDPEAKSRAL